MSGKSDNKKRKQSEDKDEPSSVNNEKMLELESKVREQEKELREKEEEVKKLKQIIDELQAKVEGADEGDDDDELSEDETDKLNPNDPWDKNIIKLLEFRAANGHCNVPISVPGLGKWVTNQRYNYTKGKLKVERIIQLENIGFIWGKNHPAPMSWEEGLEELKKYKKTMGHCNILVDAKKPS
jgi:hypothetical protein